MQRDDNNNNNKGAGKKNLKEFKFETSVFEFAGWNATW